MKEFGMFLNKFGGAIIGGLIAVLILCTHLYNLIIWIVFICLGLYLGYYVQHNKDKVKTKLKSLIDKM